MTQLQETGGIVEELNQEKVTVNVESLKRVERKRTYAEVLSNIVTNTVVNEFKAEKSDKDNIMWQNICKANYGLCGYDKIESDDFPIENKIETRKRAKGRG